MFGGSGKDGSVSSLHLSAESSKARISTCNHASSHEICTICCTVAFFQIMLLNSNAQQCWWIKYPKWKRWCNIFFPCGALEAINHTRKDDQKRLPLFHNLHIIMIFISCTRVLQNRRRSQRHSAFTTNSARWNYRTLKCMQPMLFPMGNESGWLALYSRKFLVADAGSSGFFQSAYPDSSSLR